MRIISITTAMDLKRTEHPTALLFAQEHEESFLQMRRQKKNSFMIRKKTIEKRKGEMESDLWFDKRRESKKGHW